MTTTTDSYVLARDARVLAAMRIFQELKYGTPGAKKLVAGILTGGLGVLIVASMAMIFSVGTGLIIFSAGCAFFVIGIVMSIVVELMSDNDLELSFRMADHNNPEFVAAMEKYKEERVREEWNSDTI